jgi:hypothetical protein
MAARRVAGLLSLLTRRMAAATPPAAAKASAQLEQHASWCAKRQARICPSSEQQVQHCFQRILDLLNSTFSVNSQMNHIAWRSLQTL